MESRSCVSTSTWPLWSAVSSPNSSCAGCSPCSLVSVSFELLGLDDSGVGWLLAIVGIGGIGGGFWSVTLTRRRRLGRPFAVALSLWGLPIAVIGLVPNTTMVVAALLTIGIANATLDVCGFTMIQRFGTDRNLGRVFGVLFTFGIAIGGIGALAAPVLVSAFGLRPVLLLVGAILPAVSVRIADPAPQHR